jgi:hypothetical protein
MLMLQVEKKRANKVNNKKTGLQSGIKIEQQIPHQMKSSGSVSHQFMFNASAKNESSNSIEEIRISNTLSPLQF